MSYSPAEPNILSRRYELPTCLLEVWAERSPLSDWQSQIVAQNLRFRLQLDHNRKIIKGNQQQIVNLIEAVTAYCDRWIAQDSFDSLNHAIEVPKLPKLRLSTLQLFDLYESLELCASELVILPNLVLEVRRFSPNWLKIIAGAIAIVGISFGAIRMISRDQPSFQVASTPAASSPEQANSLPPNNLERSESTAKEPARIADSSKSANAPTAPKMAIPAKPNASIPNSNSPQPSQNIDREGKKREGMDKVAIAPDTTNTTETYSRNDQKTAPQQLPSIIGGVASSSSRQSRPLESPNKDALSSPEVNTEMAKPSPSSPTKIIVPSAVMRSRNADVVGTTNIKVLQIQTELPSDVSTSLVRYIQLQPIQKSATGVIVLDLEMSGDRILNIATDDQGSTLKDEKAIADLEKLIRAWRSPHPVTGKIRLVLQLL